MTRFQALYVKYLRTRLDGSWRWVDGMYNRRYVEKIPFNPSMTYGGNQICGMDLCEQAQDLLDEDTIKDGWN